MKNNKNNCVGSVGTENAKMAGGSFPHTTNTLPEHLHPHRASVLPSTVNTKTTYPLFTQGIKIKKF